VTDLATSTERLLNQVSHWAERRWRGGAAEQMFALVQLLADLAAEAEGRPPRPVPRERDVTLPDQLRVMTDDLLAAGPSPAMLAKATEAVDAVRHAVR
jgi:hypothetical protein